MAHNFGVGGGNINEVFEVGFGVGFTTVGNLLLIVAGARAVTIIGRLEHRTGAIGGAAVFVVITGVGDAGVRGG